jgi:hypothetical protein
MALGLTLVALEYVVQIGDDFLHHVDRTRHDLA